MGIRANVFLAVLGFAIAIVVGTVGAAAQQAPQRIVLKSGETVTLTKLFSDKNCRSTLIGTPVIEVLEGPEKVTLTFKEGMVVNRIGNCANPVAGGSVMATAKDVKAPKESRLTFRLNVKTLDGDHQSAFVYLVSLFP